MSQFTSREEYYSSLFHELVHWTGHQSRLNRQNLDYATEELVAELGASYLCAIAGISQAVINNQTAYINDWLRLILFNNQRLLNTSRFAQESVDLIIRQM